MSCRTVIVADDDEDIRESVASVLEGEGYTVLTARDGAEALEVLDLVSDSRSLLLLDLMMPRMSGFDVLDLLASQNRLGALPVIVCSAMRRPAVFPVGVRGVLEKPVSLDSLLPLVASVAALPESEVRMRLDSRIPAE